MLARCVSDPTFLIGDPTPMGTKKRSHTPAIANEWIYALSKIKITQTTRQRQTRSTAATICETLISLASTDSSTNFLTIKRD
jgi:hypothetical protein